MVKVNRNNKKILCNNKQLDMIEKMINDNRRYFGSSGASLTHQISNPIYEDKGIESGLAKAGLEGEHRTSRLLLNWMKDKPNVVLVDSVHLKTYGQEEFNEETGVFDGGDTDHVLIIGNFVIIIDSKNWKGRRRYSIKDDGEVIRGNSVFPGGKVSTLRASKLWAEALKPHRAIISSIVNISSDKVSVTRDRNWWKQSYRLVTLELLEEFLNDVWEKLPESSKDNININLITSIAANAIKPYDVFKEQLGEVSELLEV
ncbi:MAG TPA: NERD domain-containing protein [Clostridiales bacterium]|nr:NERD domain-containing protein [Clostridiales bacterium]